MDSKVSVSSNAFAEFVRPSLWVLLPAILLGLGVGLVALPLIEPAIALGLSLAVTLITALTFFRSGYTVAIESNDGARILRVGAASIPVDSLGEIRIASGREMLDERGPKLHARSYRRFQSGVKTLVVIEITDAADPTPFWVFNVRRANDLASALKSAKS